MNHSPTTVVQRLWNYCNVLRDDGVSYGDYVEQLTYLLFLKMADEQIHELGKERVIPDGMGWRNLPRQLKRTKSTVRRDANKHHRRSIRLPGYDYASPGAYFVTICVHGGECLLGEIVDGEMRLSEWGQVASHYWMRIPDHFEHVELDAWVVMPNHLHGVVLIVGRGEASPGRSSSTDNVTSGGARPQGKGLAGDASPLRSGSLGAIVGNYKSVSTRRINRLRGSPGCRFWQRNYWEHIVRDDRSLNRIREYIQNNPARWVEDRLHPDAPPNPFNRWQPLES